MPRLFEELELAHGDARFPRLFRSITKAQLLILDDWGPDRLTATQRRDLMEIVEERYGRGSTMITSQLPITVWHDVIGEPNVTEAEILRQAGGSCEFGWQGAHLVHRQGRAGQAGDVERTRPLRIADGRMCHRTRMAELEPTARRWRTRYEPELETGRDSEAGPKTRFPGLSAKFGSPWTSLNCL
jgi:hypothetical protein